MGSRSKIILVAVVALLLLASTNLSASGERNSWVAELDLGLWTVGGDCGSRVASTGVDCRYSGNGLSGGVTVGRWISKSTLLTMTFAGLDVNNESKVQTIAASARTSLVSRLQLGASYYLPGLGHGFRPFVSLAAGPIVAYEGRTEAGSFTIAESRSEVAFGLRAGLGFDFPVSQSILVGMGAGMNMMTDFQNPVNGRANYSGGELQLRIGLMFGGSV